MGALCDTQVSTPPGHGVASAGADPADGQRSSAVEKPSLNMGPQSPCRAPPLPRGQGSRCVPPTTRSRDPHTPLAACEGAGRQHAAYMERMGATSSREAIRIPISQMQAVSSRAHVGSPLALPWPKTWRWGERDASGSAVLCSPGQGYSVQPDETGPSHTPSPGRSRDRQHWVP